MSFHWESSQFLQSPPVHQSSLVYVHAQQPTASKVKPFVRQPTRTIPSLPRPIPPQQVQYVPQVRDGSPPPQFIVERVPQVRPGSPPSQVIVERLPQVWGGSPPPQVIVERLPHVRAGSPPPQVVVEYQKAPTPAPEPREPVIIERLIRDPPPNWNKEYSVWASAKNDYLCCLFFSIIICIGLALIWPTILVSKHMYRHDTTTYLLRVRWLNDNITYYEQRMENDARLCFYRTTEQAWGDDYLTVKPLLAQTFTDLAKEKSYFSSGFSANSGDSATNIQSVEASAIANCGAASAPSTTLAYDVMSASYDTQKATYRSAVKKDSLDTDKMLWMQESELIETSWQLWVAIYIAYAFCGTVLAVTAAAYGNLTAKAHAVWDAGAFGKAPDTIKAGKNQMSCTFFFFFMLVMASIVCFSLENSGSRTVNFTQDLFEYGHQLNRMLFLEEKQTGNSRLCAQTGASQFKVSYHSLEQEMQRSLAKMKELLDRIRGEWGSRGDAWDNNRSMLDDIETAYTLISGWDSTVMNACVDRSSATSSDLDLPFSAAYYAQQTIIRNRLAQLIYLLRKYYNDNIWWMQRALKDGYRGATIFVTVFWSLIAFAFFFYMMSLVNNRWMSKKPVKAIPYH